MFTPSKNDKKNKPNIYEITHIRDLLKECHYNTCLVFDLDNTVMESSQELGSDQWFVNLHQYVCQSIPDQNEAVNLVLSVYHAVQHHTKMQAVEQSVARIIHLLQEIRIPVLALTARGKHIAQPTLQQLNSIGIDFSAHWPKNKLDLILQNNKEVQFDQGVLFCEGENKGECLKTLFKTTQFFPQQVTMIDDKEKHLHRTRQAVEEYGGKFVGLRYSYLDDKVKAFDLGKSMQQLSANKHLFSPCIQQAVDEITSKHVQDTSLKVRV